MEKSLLHVLESFPGWGKSQSVFEKNEKVMYCNQGKIPIQDLGKEILQGLLDKIKWKNLYFMCWNLFLAGENPKVFLKKMKKSCIATKERFQSKILGKKFFKDYLTR